jgi:hypothetical protein
MIFVWDLTKDLVRPSDRLLRALDIQRSGALTRFVTTKSGQPYSNAVFTISVGKLYGITRSEALGNLGYSGAPFNLVSPEVVELSGGLINVVHPYILKDPAGNSWLIDSGTKRQIPNVMTSSWTTGQTVTEVSQNYLNLIPTAPGTVSKSVNTNGVGTIFAVINGERYGISSYQKYISGGYAPYTPISRLLYSLMRYPGDI